MKGSLCLFRIIIICLSCSFADKTLAKSYVFDPNLVGETGKDIDFEIINNGLQMPGVYKVDIIINAVLVENRDVEFFLKEEKGTKTLSPCLTIDELNQYGVNKKKISRYFGEEKCVNLLEIPDVNYTFDFYNQSLLINIPQRYLYPKLNGIAPKELWDDGVSALLLNYSANASRTDYLNNKSHSDSSYVQLNPGINLGAWRLRSQLNWQDNSNTQKGWESPYTYLERGLYDLSSTFTIGDRYTPGDIFDSISFRGFMLGTNENMVPSNLRSYAPVITGIAKTQARVEVRQRGYTIYSAIVPPGPFSLLDLATPGDSGGNLDVYVFENNGSVQVFTVPYQTPAIAVKEGYLKYNIMAGEYRGFDAVNPMVYQGTFIYGLPLDLTVYSGAQYTDNYLAGEIGIGLSLGEYGALSTDITASKSQRKDSPTEEGVAFRARYSKAVVSTDTTMSVTGYRHATKGFDTIEQVINSYGRKNLSYIDGDSVLNGRIKDGININLQQTLGDFGSLGVNFATNNYWDCSGNNRSAGVNYGFNMFSRVNATLSFNQNLYSDCVHSYKTDRIASLWLSIPLGNWLGGAVYSSYQLTSDSDGRKKVSAGVNGRNFDNRLSWDFRQSHDNNYGNSSDNSYMRLNWNGTYGQAGISYNYSNLNRQSAADIRGGSIIYESGMVVGQDIGNSTAIIEAPGADGVSLLRSPSIKTDFRGKAISSSLIPYQENIIGLESLDLPDNVEIIQTDKVIIPTEGAIIPVKFDTRLGARVFMTIKRVRDGIVPFGSVVSISGSNMVMGFVGMNGEVYLTGLPEQGELDVKWHGGQCKVRYNLKSDIIHNGVHTILANCI
ncbi:outer membrane usher protein [Grimontella sp. AG753]|nr:outer membrane usher protein [Grimontella sp. AG753]